jgi:hypothetical protein
VAEVRLDVLPWNRWVADNAEWLVQTSQPSSDGFRALALDPYEL